MRTHNAINAQNDPQVWCQFMDDFSPVAKLARFITGALVLVIWAVAPGRKASCAEQERGSPSSQTESSSFPDPNEVFEGRVFRNNFDRDVFFIRRIRENYPVHWPSLLEANIDTKSYVVTPDKLLRFIEELGTAIAGTDDLAAITNLTAITSDPIFYANTNAYRPEILRAAASTLIRIGPRGRLALANSFSETHYRTDSVSLEVLAEVIGKAGVADSSLSAALAATAFTLTATNGGSYPRCTKEITRNLLRLPEGIAAIQTHLNSKEIFKDPGRFVPAIEAIAEARALGLTTNLIEVQTEVAVKLKALADHPGPYMDDLSELQAHIGKAVEQLRTDSSASTNNPAKAKE
jgi:hypothetical protein